MEGIRKIHGICACGAIVELEVEFEYDNGYFTKEDSYKVLCNACGQELDVEARITHEDQELYVKTSGFGGYLELLNDMTYRYLRIVYARVIANDIPHETGNSYTELLWAMKCINARADELVSEIILDTYEVDQFVKKGEKR